MSVSGQLEMEVPHVLAVGDSQNSRDPFNFGPGIRGWFRAGTSFLAVLTMLVVGIIYIFALYRPDMNDPDIWWHIHNAQYLFQHHQLPRQDTYSFTVAGHPWINHEWLSEVPYYLAWRAFGIAGVKSLSIVLIIVIFLGVLYLCFKTSGNFKASVAACAFTSLLATVS